MFPSETASEKDYKIEGIAHARSIRDHIVPIILLLANEIAGDGLILRSVGIEEFSFTLAQGTDEREAAILQISRGPINLMKAEWNNAGRFNVVVFGFGDWEQEILGFSIAELVGPDGLWAVKIPCPFVYARGERCSGHVFKAEAYGQARPGEDILRKHVDGYRLWCSEKDDHAGRVKTFAGKLRMYFHPDELPAGVEDGLWKGGLVAGWLS